MLKTKIKAGSVTNLSDARYFAARGAEWIGFDMRQDSENFIPAGQVKVIRDWVEGVKIVGEFGNSPVEDILKISGELNLDAVQLVFPRNKEELNLLSSLPVFMEFSLYGPSGFEELFRQMSELSITCQAFILKTGTGTVPALPIPELKSLCAVFKVLLDLETDPATTAALLDEIKPYGLCLSGGKEEKVGFKSFENLDAILDKLEI